MNVLIYVQHLYMTMSYKMPYLIHFETNDGGNSLTNGEVIGGGEILQTEITNKYKYSYFDESVMQKLQSLPYVKVAICILLLVLAIAILIRWYRIRSLILSDSLLNVISTDKKLKKRDKKILKTERRLGFLKRVVNNTGLGLSREKEDYINYNLRRADVRVGGKDRYMTASEFNACIKAGMLTWIFTMLLVGVFFNMMVSLIGAIIGAILITTMPLTIIKLKVEEKENEIKEEFPNLYVNIHSAIKGKADIKFVDVFKDYKTTTDSEEMTRLVDTCLDMMNEFGEYEATQKIMQEFKEISEIKTTMRLIRQYQAGADVEREVDGLKDSLLERQEDAINTRGDKLVDKANRSLIWVIVILFQVLATAMLPYLKDMISFKGLL